VEVFPFEKHMTLCNDLAGYSFIGILPPAYKYQAYSFRESNGMHRAKFEAWLVRKSVILKQL
jgi:hypothetical protein